MFYSPQIKPVIKPYYRIWGRLLAPSTIITLKFLQLSDWYHEQTKIRLSKQTLCDIIKNRDKIESCFRSPGSVRIRREEYSDLEKCLWYWFSDCRAHNLPLSDDMLIAQAKIFGIQIGVSSIGFHYKKGWLRKFKKRYLSRDFKWWMSVGC